MASDKIEVLIVEDDPIQSLLLEKMFLSLGYKVLGKAVSGKLAIDLAKKFNPDLITMDIMLTDDIDGIEAAKVIQSHMKVDLVYLSGNKDADILNCASETDFERFFRKPYNFNELKNFFSEYRDSKSMAKGKNI